MGNRIFCEYSVRKEQDAVRPDGSFPCVDAHVHLFDFLHESDGLEALAAAMDDAAVDKAVLFGMPMVKLWNEHAARKPQAAYMYNDSRLYHYSATDYRLFHALGNCAPHIRDRFFPFVCGVNTCDMNAAFHLERLLKDFSGKVYGVGELMSRHDDLSAMTYGELPRADHPAMLRILDVAAEHGLPVLMHHNIGESYMDAPLYLGEMERALEHNASASIIWAHAGISRRTELSNLSDIVENLLKKHDNLYFDISWFVFDTYIMKDEASLDRWCRLFERYQDRCVFGTDAVGHWADYTSLVARCYALFKRLPESVAHKMARANMLSLLPEKH